MTSVPRGRRQAPARTFVIITCEHGGNRIPAPYRHRFGDAADLLASHRGYDPGALVMAKALARSFSAPLVYSTVSRLLVDLNRSVGHPALYSEASRGVSRPQRKRLLERYYHPYRTEVEALVRAAAKSGRRVVHCSSHSFTPVLEGLERKADVGLLYDPARLGEVALAKAWAAALARRAPALRVRRNSPYQGRNDGLTRHLRQQFNPECYVGVELEINQKHVVAGAAGWRRLRAQIVAALHEVVDLHR